MTTKTTNVTSMVSTEETKEFKKRRMKEVRTLVARAHKQGKRVDQMGFEGTDVPRAMIALQDLLAKSEERHGKATKHIVFSNQKDHMMAITMKHIVKTAIKQQKRIGELSIMLRREREEHMRTASLTDTKIREIEGLKLALKGVVQNG